MTRPIRHTTDDWSVITTEHLPPFFPLPPQLPASLVALEVDGELLPGYVPPRTIPATWRAPGQGGIHVVALDPAVRSADVD